MTPIPTIENHVIVIWPWAKKRRKIERYIRRHFFILDEKVGTTTLRRFYGRGPSEPVKAQVFVVRVMFARLPRQTTTGRRPVNPIMFDTKQKLREWGGKDGALNSVHASDDQEEAVRNLNDLLPIHPTYHRSGVVLRKGDDVDILVENKDLYVAALGAIRIDAYNIIDVTEVDVKYKYLVRVKDRTVILDIREPGDGYMDARWQQAILESGEYDEYAQLYHALVHKGEDGDMRKLLAYMDEHGYEFTRPTDPYFVSFNVLIGKVADGLGAASTSPQPGLWEKWVEGCGYEPYSGTLNIEYEGRFQLGEPAHTSSMDLFGPQGKAGETPLHFWPAQIRGQEVTLTAGGNQPNQVEVLAPIHLKSTLGLETGDQIAVAVTG